ncbi:hypothetical protein HRbin12_01488 [bacterium HR12]|nr:hypothetical protein HRbin12_01488 [bacterium HR12]
MRPRRIVAPRGSRSTWRRSRSQRTAPPGPSARYSRLRCPPASIAARSSARARSRSSGWTWAPHDVGWPTTVWARPERKVKARLEGSASQKTASSPSTSSWNRSSSWNRRALPRAREAMSAMPRTSLSVRGSNPSDPGGAASTSAANPSGSKRSGATSTEAGSSRIQSSGGTSSTAARGSTKGSEVERRNAAATCAGISREREARSLGAPRCRTRRKEPSAASRRYVPTNEVGTISGTASVTRASTVSRSCAPVSAWDRPSRAEAVSAASRSLARSRAFSNATAAWAASTSTTRTSSSSNRSIPRLESTMAPMARPPTFIGTTRIDSSISGVPGIWTPSGSRRASAA